MIQPKPKPKPPPPKTIQQHIDDAVALIPGPTVAQPAAAPMFVFAGSNNQINASLQGDIYVNQAKAGEHTPSQGRSPT